MSFDSEKAKAKTLSFVVLSTVFHVAVAGVVTHLSYKAITNLPDVTEFEIHSDNEISTAKNFPAAPPPETTESPTEKPVAQTEERPSPSQPEVEAEPPKALPLEEQRAQAEVPMVAPKTKKASEQRPAVARTSLPAPTIKEAQSELTELEKSEDVAEEASRAALATQIAPLNTPTIDDSDLPIVNAEPVDEKQIQNDIDGSLEKIETGDVKTASIDDDLNEAIKEKDDSLNQAMAAAQADEDREHAARTAVIQAEKLKAEELRKQELAEQAEVNALAAQKAAQLAAALKAEQAAAALAAQQEAAEKAASAQAFAAAQAAESLAKANQVRALEELKQKPGNKKPLYDNEDRLNQRAGEVSFLALINKAGEPVQFKLVKSTGHKTLDLKTLKAIRNWKFYPGQEGWVEIPFKWDLQGGAQEMPATLRRKVSQN